MFYGPRPPCSNTEPGLPRFLSAKTQHTKTQKLLLWQREIKKYWEDAFLMEVYTGYRLAWGNLLLEDADFDYISHRLETKVFVSGHSEYGLSVQNF